MDDIPNHKKLRRPKQKPARLATLQLPCWPELGLKLPALLFSDRKLLLSDRKLLFSDRKVLFPEVHNPLQPAQCPDPRRKSKAARKGAGAEKDSGANKGPLAESWRVVEEAGAAYRSALADELAGLGMVVTGGACAKMHPIPWTNYCVLPAIKSSSRPVEPIRASASERVGPLGCRATPDGKESAYSSPPPPPPPSPPPSPPLTPCQLEAQSPGCSPTLNDPVTRETTPSLLSSETGDELSVLEAMMSHPHWKIINRVLLRKNKCVAELQERSEEVMEWVLKVTHRVVLPAMARVLHIRKDQDGRPLSAAISYSSCDSQSDRSSSAGLLSTASPVTGSLTGMVCFNPADFPQDQASSLGSTQPYVPQGILRMISERFHPLLIGGQGSRPQSRLLGGRPPMLDSDRPTEEEVLATASLAVAEILLKVKVVMDKQEHDADDKLSACVEELYESVMGQMLETFALHHRGCLLSDCHVTSISQDLIYNAWQDAKEKIQVLAKSHTDAINELVSPWPTSSADTRERMEMASFLTGSVAEEEEMENAMALPSRVMSPTLCSLKESLSGILARHALFHSPGVVPTEEKLELVRMVGGFLQEMEPTEGRCSLDQPQEAYEASLVQSVATACNVIHNVLKNFHAAQQLIGQVEVADFLQPGSKTFTMVVECVSQSLLGDVAVELDALWRRRSSGASNSNGRSSRNKEYLPFDTQQERPVECSRASKEEQEEEDPQKKEETAPPSSRSTSARSDASSAASYQDLSFTAENMLDIIMRMAYLASSSSPDDDDKRDEASSVKSFDQEEYDMERLLASHSMCTRMFQGRIHHFSKQLVEWIYQLLLDTRMGRLPSTPHCRSEPNFQNLEDKERLDQEFFTPLLYYFFQMAFKGLMGNLLGEEDVTDDHRADSCSDASSDGSDSNSDSSSDSDCPSLDWSSGMTRGSQGVEGRRRSQSRLKPSCSQDQRWALEAICEVLTTQAGSDLYKTCNDPQENMVVVRKGLDAKAMARFGNLASSSSEDQEVTTGSLDPESGLTNQEVGQPEMDDNENADYSDDFHEEEDGSDCQMNDFSKGALIEEEEKDEDDGAAGLPEEVQDHPSLPVSPSETPSLQPGEVLIQEKVLMPPQPSALHHQTLHDLLQRLVGRLALQGPLRSCFTPTNSEIEAVLLQDVSWFLWNQAGIGLVLEHEPQNLLFGGADALDAMFEATYAELMLCSDSNRALVHSALQGGAGIVGMAENVATVICRHAEFWRPSAVSGESHDLETGCEENESTEDSAGLVKAGGSSSPFISNTSFDEGLEMDTAGLEKACRNSSPFITNTSLDEGLEMDSAALEKAGGSSSPFLSNTSLEEGLEMESAGLEKASRLASCLTSSSTSWSCYSSSSTSVHSSPSSSKSSTSSSTSRGSTAQAPSPEGHNLGKTDTPILRKWFALKKEKTFLKNGQNVAAKGRKTSIFSKTNKVSPLSAEGPDLGESSIAGGEEKKKKKKKKSFKDFFRGISAALSGAFCFGCVKDIHQ
ncbi:uncharacterized protein LOC124483445 [Hypomesus transpacificus]|uniref:uncharacterized protein LOC124483444 n=1 Tax=Hypomesus transpacificus TaxID=137520 RepID=UPI001F072E96|nr:uncharacterized protein LOC124483444 [Hypomesus transpacificus]XP_046899865.1 uncharacterized protein LOC124483445 [Hypomesus transpacificus]